MPQPLQHRRPKIWGGRTRRSIVDRLSHGISAAGVSLQGCDDAAAVHVPAGVASGRHGPALLGGTLVVAGATAGLGGGACGVQSEY